MNKLEIFIQKDKEISLASTTLWSDDTEMMIYVNAQVTGASINFERMKKSDSKLNSSNVGCFYVITPMNENLKKV